MLSEKRLLDDDEHSNQKKIPKVIEKKFNPITSRANVQLSFKSAEAENADEFQRGNLSATSEYI